MSKKVSVPNKNKKIINKESDYSEESEDGFSGELNDVLIKKIDTKEYICPRCKDPFYTNKELKNHTKKMAKCPIRNASSKKLPACRCDCGKHLSSPYSLKRHTDICPYIEKINNVTDLFRGYELMIPYTTDFNVEMFAKTEMDTFLDPQNNFYLSYFKIVHCNENRYNYYNIYYPHHQTKYIFVYTVDEIWEKHLAIEIIDKIIFTIRNELKIFLTNECHKTSEVKNRLTKYINLINKKHPDSKNMLRLNTDILCILKQYAPRISQIFIKSNAYLKLTKNKIIQNRINSSSDSSSGKYADNSVEILDEKKPIKINSVEHNNLYDSSSEDKSIKYDDLSDSSSEKSEYNSMDEKKPIKKNHQNFRRNPSEKIHQNF